MREHPDSIDVAEALAGADLAANRLDQAEANLKSVLERRPRDPVVLNNLAWIYQQQGDKRAEALARQAYILLPNGQTADTLGWILLSEGNAAQSAPLLRQAAEQVSSDPRILYHYGVALKQTGNREEAIKVLNAVVASKGDFVEKAEARKLLDELGNG